MLPDLPSPFEPPAVQFFLRQARRLQRAARSASPSTALPVLRRLIKAGAIGETALTVLFRNREQLQRKHFLRMLALEKGFASWEAFRPALAQMNATELAAQQFLASGAAQLKLWFPTTAAAQQYACEHGGLVISAGTQAVVIPD
ncbi:hypothetical protein [Chitinilyticum litopenaei]|uniref:hypothetical protein n=1 Tax=Chitinilyticum litopenaei TaxID=1121276 RepID=UPI000427A139|nr:hypothetical protein [Chitinilyticum litopenaei]